MALKNENGFTEEQINEFIGTMDHLGRAIMSPIPPVVGGVPRDETGGYVASLTEAVMGVTAGLCKIADAIDGLSDTLRKTLSKNEQD